jgi:hypothetical protein
VSRQVLAYLVEDESFPGSNKLRVNHGDQGRRETDKGEKQATGEHYRDTADCSIIGEEQAENSRVSYIHREEF